MTVLRSDPPPTLPVRHTDAVLRCAASPGAHRPPTVPAACCTEIPPPLCQVAFVLDELSRPRAAALLVSRALLLLIYMARPRVEPVVLV